MTDRLPFFWTSIYIIKKVICIENGIHKDPLNYVAQPAD